MLRVFLAEDLPASRALIGELFDALGGIRLAGVAANEAEARLWLEENRSGWDVAIVDLVLEQGSGLGVVEYARLTSRSGMIAVFSSYASPGIEQHCMRIGANAVFQKGETRDFVLWLKNLVEGSAPSP